MEDWKEKLSQLSTSTERTIEDSHTEKEQQSIVPQEQQIVIELDKKRKGKTATILSGFLGTEKEIKSLAKMLKLKCGSGGSFRDDEILIQGDCREKTAQILQELGFLVIQR